MNTFTAQSLEIPANDDYAMAEGITMAVLVIACFLTDYIRKKKNECKTSEESPQAGPEVVGRLPGLATGDVRDEQHYRTQRAPKHKRRVPWH